MSQQRSFMERAASYARRRQRAAASAIVPLAFAASAQGAFLSTDFFDFYDYSGGAYSGGFAFFADSGGAVHVDGGTGAVSLDSIGGGFGMSGFGFIPKQIDPGWTLRLDYSITVTWNTSHEVELNYFELQGYGFNDGGGSGGEYVGDAIDESVNLTSGVAFVGSLETNAFKNMWDMGDFGSYMGIDVPDGAATGDDGGGGDIDVQMSLVYSLVPTPGPIALLAGAGVLSVRRRR